MAEERARGRGRGKEDPFIYLTRLHIFQSRSMVWAGTVYSPPTHRFLHIRPLALSHPGQLPMPVVGIKGGIKIGNKETRG